MGDSSKTVTGSLTGMIDKFGCDRARKGHVKAGMSLVRRFHLQPHRVSVL